MDPGIQQFLDERKELWLGKKLKKEMSEDEVAELEDQAVEEFSLVTWLPDAAKRAKQLSMVSHPGKFTHPSAKVSSVIADVKFRADGYLRSGNVDAGLDVFGNAAALDVYRFLMVVLVDGRTILDHLEQNSEMIKEHLNISTASYAEIAEGLLAVKSDNHAGVTTSARVKQVYFPVLDGYHLLSILTPSNLMFAMKERINDMRFAEEVKEVRDARKNNLLHDKSLSEIYDITVVGYGGTKPQNISVLNSKNGGKAYLLSSSPPKLKSRRVNPPKNNFFAKYLKTKDYEDDFQKLHELLISDHNNVHVRAGIGRLIKSVLRQVIDRSWQIRFLEEGWSESDYYKNLLSYQKLWLDQQYKDKRQDESEWLDAVKEGMARWFLNIYEKILGHNAKPLGDEQMVQLRQMINDYEGALL